MQHHRETTNYLAGDSGNGCNINQNKEIRMNLRVPSVPPTDCSTSDIIVVKYYIDVSGFNFFTKIFFVDELICSFHFQI